MLVYPWVRDVMLRYDLADLCLREANQGDVVGGFWCLPLATSDTSVIFLWGLGLPGEAWR